MPAVAGRFIIGKAHCVFKIYPMNCIELRGNIDARPPYWVNYRETASGFLANVNSLGLISSLVIPIENHKIMSHAIAGG
jgi:hypothetical protein